MADNEQFRTVVGVGLVMPALAILGESGLGEGKQGSSQNKVAGGVKTLEHAPPICVMI